MVKKKKIKKILALFVNLTRVESELMPRYLFEVKVF